MKNLINNLRLFLLVLAGALLMTEASATNGYLSHGHGIRAKGTAGAGVALFRDALGVATNPAAAAFLDTRVDINVATFIPVREFTVTGNPSGLPGTFGLAPGSVESDKEFFVIPSIGVNWAFQADQALGLAIYGHGGMNTEYPQPVFGGSNPTGVDLSQLFLNATYSRKFGENHSLGVSGIFAYQRFKATGLEQFGNMGMSSDPNRLSDNGHDNSTGFGFGVGYLGKIAPGLTAGASYQSKIRMSEFEDYAGLFAEGGDFDIPSRWIAGLAYQLQDWLFAADVQQVFYSNVNSVGNPLNPAELPPAFPDGSGGFTPNPNQVALGENEGSGFGWNDITVVKLGTEFSGFESWVLRGGFSIGQQPIAGSEVMFNILAPGVIDKHATLGFSKELSDKYEISFTAMHGFSQSVKGPNPFEAPDQQEIELKMRQWEFEIGFSF